MSDEGTVGEHQVGTLRVQVLVDQEVLLLPSEIGVGDLAGHAHDGQQLAGGLGHGGVGFQEGGLVVEGLSCVGNEHGGDTERISDDEGGGGGVPCGIAPGLEGVPQSSAGERGCVRLLLAQQLSAELLDGFVTGARVGEGVVLLRGTAGKGLEPVGVVGYPAVDGPSLHTGRNILGDGGIEGCTPLDGLVDGPAGVGIEVLPHSRPVEYVASVVVGCLPGRSCRFDRFFRSGPLNGVEPKINHDLYCTSILINLSSAIIKNIFPDIFIIDSYSFAHRK